MSDIIRLLPDSVANQIAAGEVVQRPASVVKELIENAIDAESTKIKVIIKDAGRTLIQIIDNGKGMSETDARMAFERHATSKIHDANDLFDINTLGFRGEALASIAAVAQVELRTKPVGAEIGTQLIINASVVERLEAISCSHGSNFIVKNLFFNIPARRKFLKSNSTEFKHITTEFIRVALAYPDICFELHHNDKEVYLLQQSTSFRQRIVNVFGNNLNKTIINVEAESPLIKITGFISKPEFARKASPNQFMFINKRFMRNMLFHKAITLAMENLIPQNTKPSYFLYFETDPQTIDVNIHPTKTEIKFEHGNTIFSIIRVAIREALGKTNVIPSIDFDRDGYVEIKSINSNTVIAEPEVSVNNNYNPFAPKKSFIYQNEKDNLDNWEKLYQGLDNTIEEENNMKIESTLFDEDAIPETDIENNKIFFQYRNRYILTSVKSGLMVVDQHRAHQRLLYEKYLEKLQNTNNQTQQLLFPEKIELGQYEVPIFREIIFQLENMGFDIEEFSGDTFIINGIPSDLQIKNVKKLIQSILETYISIPEETDYDLMEAVKNKLAKSFAKTMAIPYGKILHQEDMSELIDALFRCEIPNYTTDGKLIIHIIENETIDHQFKK